MSYESKIINDPVFGFIKIPKGLLYDVVRHPLLQRLTRIKQLGLSSVVYPGAQHTRFQHSLGAYYLMSEAIQHLTAKGNFIFDSEAEAVEAAILMHDIGHGPFSHVLENTIVVFVSDHGDCMGMHENIGKNIFYEEAMRIPFMVSWKGHLIPRMDNDLLISLEDFCPSILSLMGLKEKIPATVQTRDLSEQIRGSRKKMPREQLYMLYSEVNKKGKHLTTGARGLRDARYTYAVRFKNGVITERHLYDRKNDPAQMENLVEKQSKRAQKMHRRLKELLVEKQDPAAGVL